MTTTTELYWDPFDTELDSAPHDVWRRMRDEQPVYRNERYDFWALSRFADVERAAPRPGHVQLGPRHGARDDGPTTWRRPVR